MHTSVRVSWIALFFLASIGCVQSADTVASTEDMQSILTRFEKNLRVYLNDHVVRFEGASINQLLLDDLEGEWTHLPPTPENSRRFYSKNRWTVSLVGGEIEGRFFMANNFARGSSTEFVILMRDGPKPEVLKEYIESFEGDGGTQAN
jgi:hypothetical protein